MEVRVPKLMANSLYVVCFCAVAKGKRDIIDVALTARQKIG
jgi:hypothetical protein